MSAADKKVGIEHQRFSLYFSVLALFLRLLILLFFLSLSLSPSRLFSLTKIWPQETRLVTRLKPRPTKWVLTTVSGCETTVSLASASCPELTSLPFPSLPFSLFLLLSVFWSQESFHWCQCSLCHRCCSSWGRRRRIDARSQSSSRLSNGS